MVDAAQITGVVLAGGRGLRMGGVDKGLQLYQGIPLALHALRRLQPQVGRTVINANRHADQYAAFGVPVLADEHPDYAGPLAGFASALRHCSTPFLLTVPCDSPLFPPDLATRLAAPLGQADCDITVVVAPESTPDRAASPRAQPVFCLMRTRVLPGLEAFMAGGGRKIDAWTAGQRTQHVHFTDARAFLNVNTLAELEALRP
jgi:molybdopterin-guanine dinucleotide biosynthesis protein A